MKYKKTPLSLLLVFCGVSYAAPTQQIISSIEVEGNEKIESATVLSYINFQTPHDLDLNSSDKIIDNLYKTGFFSDIKLITDAGKLVIKLEENPTITELKLSGDKAFDHDLVLKALKSSGIDVGSSYSKNNTEQAINTLKNEYYNLGYYSVIITPTVTKLPRNRVSLDLVVSEGLPATISEIQFTGNTSYSNAKLSSIMQLSTWNLFTFYTSSNQYSSEKLSGDLETIKNFYMSNGYLDIKVNGMQVQATPNKKQMYLTINLNEGSQYKIGNIQVSGDTKEIKLTDIESLITLKSGNIINRIELNKNIEAIKSYLGIYGYAFPVVSPVPNIIESTNIVNYNIYINTGNKVYVRKIDISGNNATRDVVVRREFRQPEGALYNSEEISRTKTRLDLLGYFSKTTITPVPVIGTNNQVDLDTKVEERSTGGVNLTLGYAQTQGIILNGSITKTNLFGSGKSASLSASTSSLSQNVTASFTDPYFLTNGTSLGYDVYYNDFSPNKVGISPYSTQTVGTKVRTSIPISEYDKLNFSAGVENDQVSVFGNSVPSRFAQFNQQYGNNLFELPVSMGWSRNTTDNFMWPTSGATFSDTIDGTLPGVGAQYYRFTSNNNWFIPIANNLTWKINGQLGFINSYGENSLVPFFQNYFEGGIGSIRGYALSSIGPSDTDGSALGGTRMTMLSNEFLFPMPGLVEERTLRVGVFLDTGSLWGGNPYNLTPGEMFRASYGMGLTWLSPLGAIKISYALPINDQPNDILQPFQFTFGSAF